MRARALFRMLMAVRWSMTDCLYTWFSALRCSPACLRAISMSASSFCSSEISVWRVSMAPTRDWCFSSRSDLVRSFTLISSSVRSISFLHCVHLAYSSFCCFSSSASILSMAALTFSKASRRTVTARATRDQFLCFFAIFAIIFMARSAARSCLAASSVEAETWRKAMVLPKVSRASSERRIFRVSVRATASSLRTLARFAYSESSLAQDSFMLPRNSVSAARAPWVASRSALAFAHLSVSSASSACLESLFWVAAAISPSLAAFRPWKAASAAFSVAVASFRSRCISSLISDRRPKMPPLREL
mmetsp:Transcript_24928/g.74215  ORF Transcript_24928/g.74215 Transcript_24928/m.74215 type:complete len:304 (-) Transcript_24928:492-1403(-)